MVAPIYTGFFQAQWFYDCSWSIFSCRQKDELIIIWALDYQTKLYCSLDVFMRDFRPRYQNENILCFQWQSSIHKIDVEQNVMNRQILFATFQVEFKFLVYEYLFTKSSFKRFITLPCHDKIIMFISLQVIIMHKSCNLWEKFISDSSNALWMIFNSGHVSFIPHKIYFQSFLFYLWWH